MMTNSALNNSSKTAHALNQNAEYAYFDSKKIPITVQNKCSMKLKMSSSTTSLTMNLL